MDKNNLLKVSFAPHAHGGQSVSQIMLYVIVALLPAMLVGIWVFGPKALEITLTAVISCVLFEYFTQKFILKVKPTINDFSAAVTGVLLAFNLPSNIPLWMVVIGSFAAIVIAKMTYGGIGNNPFNPALVGRVFLLVSFPVAMTSWPKPFAYTVGGVDVITAATPLSILKEGVKNTEALTTIMAKMPSYLDLFIGIRGGCIGEISVLALILGGIYLLYKKIISWHIPVSMIFGILIFSGILWLTDPSKYADPFFHIMTGGVFLGAIFMATDMVTSPITPKGKLIFGSLIGILVILIRVFGAYPEGVSFAILIMNAFVPLIDRYTRPKRFGE
ncbi:MAG: RnfABCDGE type electron transport complex subunit D [Candidatus Omnitrophica bacterium]|nr:RnfABCDGE type electron transport complex subunit D [Candidatus Omnitrophota bacterium]